MLFCPILNYIRLAPVEYVAIVTTSEHQKHDEYKHKLHRLQHEGPGGQVAHFEAHGLSCLVYTLTMKLILTIASRSWVFVLIIDPTLLPHDQYKFHS